MGTEVAAVVDLRNLTQPDLVALAAASPHAVDPARGGRRDADFLPPPKIDRAVFNESAGSRKQTFSRRRVATNISHNLTPTAAASSSSAAAVPSEEDSENRLIVFHLQRLFASDDPSYPSPPPIPPRPQTLTAPTTVAPAPSLPPTVAAVDPDKEVMNPKGVPVDLVRLAELVEPFGEELQKRTAGLVSEPELLGFMNSLEGQWGSRRRRRKFVDAGIFGDHLPRGWKLLLGLKRKERVAWINCRRYVSPKGHQFASCKEVASYLMSLLGYLAKPTGAHSNSAGVHAAGVLNSVGLHQQTGATEDRPIALPVTSVSLLSHSGGDSHQQKLQNDETQIEANTKGCRKCNLTFHDQSAYMQHQLSFHQRKAKKRRISNSDELVTSINGKSEPQGFQKTSEGGPGNIGHGVADVSYQGQSPAKLFDWAFSGELGGQPSLSSGFKEMTSFSEQEKEHSAIDHVSVNHKDLKQMIPEQEKRSPTGVLVSGHPKDHLKELPGFPEQEKGLSSGDPFSQHHHYPTETSDDHKNHDGASNDAVASLAIDAERKLNPCNLGNVHENGSSRDLECSTVDISQNFNRSGELCIIPEKVSLTTHNPHESKSTGDPADCADVTQSKQVSEPCDPLRGKFVSSKENDPLSATLDEPDLNSDAMEVDNGEVNPTSFKNEKPVEDKIMGCGFTSLRDDKFKSGMRIRDVNLNSCSDAISSPVSGGNETSNTPDEATRSSIIAQCFGTSSNDDNVCKDGNFANQDNASKSENFVDQKNDMVYQSDLTMGPIPPAQMNVDCFTSSCSMASEIKSYSNRCEDSAKEAMANSRSMISNETGFDVETYNNDIFNGTITESSLAQLNNSINMKADFTSCYLSELNTLTGGTATDEIDIHGMRNSFVSSTSRNDPTEHCTLDFDIKGSMLEALEKSDSDLENQYNSAGPTCDSLPAASTSGHIDDFMSMQTNFGSFTSLVRAVEDVPLSRIIQDQCDLQLGFGGPKQPIYPTFEQQLRMASAGASPYGSMGRHDSVPVPEPTLMLGYAPQLGSCPPFQLSWGPPMSKMVGGCVLQSICVWCNSQFQHFGTVAEQQADSLGYICPACKGKFSGHLGINGPSL